MPHYNSTNTIIYIASIENLSEKELETVPQEFLSKSKKFHQENDRKRFLLGRYMLKTVVTNLEPKLKNLEIKYSKYKKPFIKDFYEFNISHSGAFVVLAISPYKIGIDIELKDKNSVILDQSIFSTEELNLMLTTLEVKNCFFNIWTAKEAIIKANGIGLNSRLNKINTLDKFCIFEGEKFFTQEIFIHKDYCCHFATNQDIISFELINFEL